VSGDVVIERKRRLDGSVVEFRCELLTLEPGKRAVLRYVIPSERRLEGTDLTLLPGTVTIAHYWTDRSYNVYAWLKDGTALGYYCSIADETEIAAGRVEYLDLVVDVLIDPRGSATVLDEHELPADLEPRHRRTISRTLEDLTSGTRRLVAEIERATRPHLA
jgi:predicted RNA-binding protein associated with RNAse of E/G family